MPKIIENLECRLLEEAKKQMAEAGYSAMTIRSVAKACGVGVGTVYNYFSSKNDMIAAFMLEEWDRCISAVSEVSRCADSPLPVVQCVHEQLVQFSRRHRCMFRDKTEAASFAGSFSVYHGRLRGQLAEILRKFCESDFASEFVAEALLTWTMARKSFDEIYSMIGKLFDGPHL